MVGIAHSAIGLLVVSCHHECKVNDRSSKDKGLIKKFKTTSCWNTVTVGLHGVAPAMLHNLYRLSGLSNLRRRACPLWDRPETSFTFTSIFESLKGRDRGTWCCYNSSCPPKYVISQASFFHLSAGQCPSAQGNWGNQLFPHSFAKCRAILTNFSKRT